MTAARLRQALASRNWPLVAACALLAAWGIGILVAAVQLDGWRQELTRTLVQLNADARFRARAHDRESVDPEWYRRKALALLSASDRLQQDAAWSLFIPGSWGRFDALEEQLQARLESEFSDIVVETVRRELYARASRLTGVPLVRGSGELQGGVDCQSPLPQNLERRLTSSAEDLPEFAAAADYVVSVQQLDEAVQSFLSLHYSGGEPEQLRRLVAYTLGRQLPGRLAGAVRMFQASDEVTVQPALMQARLQWATRCALMKAMGALHTRLLNTNDLFALEQGLVQRSAGLFEASTRAGPFDRTLERYRAVHALLDDQDALLAKGRNEWMRQATLQLGGAYQQVLKRIAQTRLLGPEALEQLQRQSGTAFAEFRRQFQLAFGTRNDPGIVWVDDEQRFALSPERVALRKGLEALLKTSFMADAAAAQATARDTPGLSRVLQEARALAQERARARAEILPVFPAGAQPAVARVIDARVSELIYQRAYRTLKAALPPDRDAPLDPAAFRQQRAQVLALQAVLKDTGGGAFGERLVAALDGELLRRLELLQAEWERQPLQAARVADFGWWHGEPLPLAQVLGAGEAGPVVPAFSRTAVRLELLVQQARALLDLGSPALPNDPAAARWLQLQSELERYTARSSNSSLLRLERYVSALGTDLKRDNCTERLAANAPAPAYDDAIAQRHVQLHQALARRCEELRAEAVTPAPTLAQ